MSFLSYMFSASHSTSEWAYFLFFLLLSYITYTFVQAYKMRLQVMKKEHLIFFGKEMYPVSEIKNEEATTNFDDLL